MKHIILVFVIGLVIASCDRDNNPVRSIDDMKYREVAWTSLSAEEKETVTIDWREAKVNKCNYWEKEQEAACVEFNTTLDPLLGPIVVFIEPVTLEVLGYAPRF